MKQITTLASVLAIMVTQVAGAQQSPNSAESGVFLGFVLSPVAIHTDKYTSDSTARTQAGIGIGAQAGYDFPMGLSLFVRFENALIPRSIGNYTLRNIDFGARARLTPLRNHLKGIVPYAEVALNNRHTKQKNLRREGEVYNEVNVPLPEVTADGINALFGIGVERELRNNLRWTAGLSRTAGKFDSVRFGGGAVWSVEWYDATDYRLHIGLTRTF